MVYSLSIPAFLRVVNCLFATWIPDAKSTKSPDTHDLTEDVILEILLRLPVKSLVRLKCVCKQWYTIIESQSFIEQHFGHKSNQERLLVRYCKLNGNREAYALFVDDNCSEFEEPAHLQMPDMISQLLGPVNGVFCLVGQSRNLALLNPATRQLKRLPKLPEVILEPHLCCSHDVHGFGLDPLSGDYKVVSIRYYPDCHPIVFIYNLGSDSWRNLGDASCYISSYIACSFLRNIYLNGVYYWTVVCTSTHICAILAFDMTTEMFEDIQVPDCLELKGWHLTFHVDAIGLLSYDLEGTSCEVWVMEKEGSWNRVAVVGPYQDMYTPLCLWKNNRLLIETNTSSLMLCNIFTKERQLTQVQAGRYISFMSRVFSYKESLVSTKGNRDNCMLWDASPDILTVALANQDQLTSRMNCSDADNLGRGIH